MHSIKDWNNIQFVLAVTETGSFFGAAERLRTHQTTVSRHIQALERELGARLFVRHAHGMLPAPAGRALAAKAAEMETVASELRTDLAGFDEQLSGNIRLYVTEGIGAHWLVPVLADFHAQYPNIRIEIVTDLMPGNMLWDELDIAITVRKPDDPRLVALRAGLARFSLFASRQYVRANGMPQVAEDLSGHRLVSTPILDMDPSFRPWRDLLDANGGPAFSSKTISLYMAAIREGFGIGFCWSFFRHLIADLVEIPIDLGVELPIWMTTHEATNMSAKVRAVRQFLRQRFDQDRLRWFA